jgi:hypothetical protein
MLPPELSYAQVVKTRAHGRIVQVDSKVVFGALQAIAEKLISSPTSATINTSFVERHNLTQRQSKQNLENLRRNRYAPNVMCETTILRSPGAQPCAPSKATFPITR